MSLLINVVIILCAVYIGDTKSINCDAKLDEICKSYFFAKECNKTENCENLWPRADTKLYVNNKFECIECLKLVKNAQFETLAHIITNSQRTISGNDLKNLQFKIKNNNTLCSILFNECSQLSFSGSICDDCKTVFDDVRNLFEDKEMKLTIKTYIKAAICVRIPNRFIDTCKRVIDSYADILINVIVEEINSEQTCATIGFCPKSLSGSMLNDSKPKYSGKKQYNSYSWIHRPSPKGFEKFTSRAKINDDVKCTGCLETFGNIRTELINPEFEELLISVIGDKFCSKLGPIKSVCVSMLTGQIDRLIKEASSTNLRDLCSFFNQCPDEPTISTKEILSQFVYSKYFEPTQVKIPFICEACESIFKTLIDFTVSNVTTEFIIYEIKQICYVFPKIERDNCIHVVDLYGNTITEAIIGGTLPKVMCLAMGVCSSSNVNNKSTKFNTCDIFVQIIAYVQEKVNENSSKQEITQLLESVCEVSIFSSFKNLCDALIDQYAPKLIEYLATDKTPLEIAQYIGVCKTPAFHQKAKGWKNLIGKNECTWGPSYVCRDVNTATKCNQLAECQKRVWGTSQPLSVPHSPASTLVDCNAPPHILCDSKSLSACGQYAINLCEKYKSQETDLSSGDKQLKKRLCRSPTKEICEKKQLVKYCGFEDYCKAVITVPIECNKGPSFSCQSVKNAKLCNAEEMCATHVWLSSP